MSQITAQDHRPLRKVRVGEVISDKMDKTIVVRVKRRVRVPIYEKVITVRHKFYVHDEKKEARLGDQVRIAETRPLSRLKRWRLVEIIAKANVIKPPPLVGEAEALGTKEKHPVAMAPGPLATPEEKIAPEKPAPGVKKKKKVE